MPSLASLLRGAVLGLAALALAGGAAGAALVAYLASRLPPVEVLRDVRLQAPLRVYTRDGRLIGEFGEVRRVPVRLAELPEALVKAVLAAEDDRFFDHPGFDWQGLTRAAWRLLRTGEKAEGGSTITMQVARNFFLGREKTYLRKLNEIILAVRIEGGLTKDEILELYLNKIYLGHRAYGVGAAAQVYYGKTVGELSVAENAMIAGLPKAPSRVNPVTDPEAAVARRNYVLGRMHALGHLDEAAYAEALAEPDRARVHGPEVETDAAHAAEVARAEVVGRLGEEAYGADLAVYTTVDSRLQLAASDAARAALFEYDERHGYRGPERRLPESTVDSPGAVDAVLDATPWFAGLRPAVVTRVEDRQALAYLRGHGQVVIPWEGMSWARPYVSEDRRGPAPRRAADVVARSDLVRLRLQPDGGWRLSQVPEAETALVALSPEDGAILALVGGLDFQRSKFNRATQARRQPGSAFKPFLYSAALEAGYTPASVVNDAPLVLGQAGAGEAWRPENYGGKFYGPTRLREALTHSRNVVSVRLLREVGVPRVVAHAERFGFRAESLPRELSLALGTGEVTPLELTAAYAVFANGGYRVGAHLVDRVEGPGAEAVYRADPARVCPDCESAPQPGAPPVAPRAISPENAWLMTSMLRDVIRRGTARRALALKRGDVAGKTGTTNDARDAWFCGYGPGLVASAWVGFDRHTPLGRGETGGRVALPIWVAFMQAGLAGTPERPGDPPPGLVTVRIDPRTGEIAGPDAEDAIVETVPATRGSGRAGSPPTATRRAAQTVTEELF
jgi:penicillin-binding protein 1A